MNEEMKRMRRMRRSNKGASLIEAMAGFFIFIPLAFAAVDIAVVANAGQVNEEFAEQLARLCSTVQSKTNAIKACNDVISIYQKPSNVASVNLDNLEFDLGLQEVSITTTMDVMLPIPFPGYSHQPLSAKAMQPIVSFPAPQ
jgi:Flp pilus assembly protein TadG